MGLNSDLLLIPGSGRGLSLRQVSAWGQRLGQGEE